MKLISTNPSENYAVLGEVDMSSQSDVEAAVTSAHQLLPVWSGMTLDERCGAVRSFVAVVKRRADEIATLITTETGRLTTTVGGHVQGAFEYLEAYCDMAPAVLAPVETVRKGNERHLVHREPYGVIAAICPWNYPLLNIVWQCGQALIAGNTIVYKNSEENPLFTQLVDELFNESDIPNGVFNVLYGDDTVGRAMIESNVDLISFTGSSATGREIAQVAARRQIPFFAEMGGSSPGIVFDDIDLDEYAGEIFWRRFFHSGQTCDSLKRLIVHESKFDEVVDTLRAIAEKVRIGPANDPETQLGPLVAERQVVTLAAQVDDSMAMGANVVIGGRRPNGLQGAYYEPTILTHITRDMRVWNEETFGPVLPVVSFETEDEAIALANDTEYGLTSYVMTNDAGRFARVAKAIKAGAVVQNHGTYDDPASPFGGYKRSGFGRTNGEFGFHEATQPKLVSFEV